MPYIDEGRRYEIDSGYGAPSTAGELNYYLTMTLLRYVGEKKLSYQTINDIIGALEGAKLEFYRRIVVPYEDKKKEENGDVYDGERSSQ